MARRIATWALSALMTGLLLPTPAAALNPAIPLQDYHHTTWTAKDGAPADVNSMAQTTDGWLWLVAPSGLHRFDGVRFERYTLPGDSAPLRRRPHSIRALRDGGLLLTFFMGGGLSILHSDGRLEHLAEPGKEIGPFVGLTHDQNGDILIAGFSGVHRYAGGKWSSYGSAHGLPRGEMDDIKLDRHGRLWTLGAKSAFLYKRASGKFEKFMDLPMKSSLISSPDGRLWISNSQGQQVLPSPRSEASAAAAAIDTYSDWSAQFDRDGNLWTLNCPIGLCLTANAGSRQSGRITPAEASSRLDQPWQMSSLRPRSVLEDREGNIWIATQAGLERFRDTKLAPVHIPNNPLVFSLSSDSEGRAWAVDPVDATAWKLSGSAAPVADRTHPYQTSATDITGALLLATGTEIERRHQGKVERIPLMLPVDARGEPQRISVLGIQDDGKVLWMMSPQTGLMGWVDGRWLQRGHFKLPQRFMLGTRSGPERPGELWIASGDGTIVQNSQERQVTYEAGMIGLPTSMHTREHVIAAGDLGIAVFKEQAFHKLSAADPEVLLNVSGLAITSNGDRWLNGGKGLIHVRKADWMASMAQPSLPLRYRLLSAHEGYRGEAMLANRLPSILVDKDDQLWISGTGGLMRLDTRNMLSNPVAPVAGVQGISTPDGRRYEATPMLALPAGAHSFNIHYTAASLRQPEGVRFQYRLDGEDNEWRDAGTRRTAYYTNMAPGSYRFQVRAINEDGVWSPQPASIAFDIPPTITQTLWFKVLCALAGGTLLTLLYRYRLRRVTARLEERMEVRVAERERIARTLHDTFLQSVQGVVLRLDTAVDALPDDSATRKTLAPILHSARGTIAEGRAQVLELRAAQVDDVESLLGELAALLQASYPGTAFGLTVSGERTLLLPRAAEEIREIAREAVRNAFQHAHAGKIDARLTYGDQCFTLLVRDDGVGMPPAIPGFNAHFGLVGMRERAARIGGTLRIDGAEGGGVRVTLTVPARRAYAGRGRRWWHKLWDRLRG